ncbi:MAG: Calx-beta domain-containing protein [Actinomycetota bacterium]
MRNSRQRHRALLGRRERRPTGLRQHGRHRRHRNAGRGGAGHLGAGRTAIAVSAGWVYTCAILDNGTVRCWGTNGSGQLGYANTTVIGDTETPDTAGPVDLGAGRTATALAAGALSTCALLDDGTVRCWGEGGGGHLGYGNTTDIGDNEAPATVGPVVLGGTLASVDTLGGSDATVNEGQSGTTNVSLPVTMSRAAPWPVTVAYTTTNASAKAGADYTATSGQLTFAPGATSATVTVPILADTRHEGSETFTITLSSPSPAVTLADATATVTISDDDLGGYWMLEADGTVYAFGDADYYGDASRDSGSAAAVDIEPSATGSGYLLLDNAGTVRPYGNATTHTPTRPLGANLPADEDATAISTTPNGGGYRIFTSKGRVATYGNATYHGDMSGIALNGPVSDAIPTPSGDGYYMIGSDGGVFAFGDAAFRGSLAQMTLNEPVVSLVADPDGSGYWLVASDGGVFAFDAPFLGSMGGTRLNRAVTGMVAMARGYLMVAKDGGVFAFGGTPFRGGLAATPPDRDIVGIAAYPS